MNHKERLQNFSFNNYKYRLVDTAEADESHEINEENLDSCQVVEQSETSYGSGQDVFEEEPKTASEAFDKILRSVGGAGLWQWKLGLIHGFSGLFTAFHNLGAVFLAASPDHFCKIPSLHFNESIAKELLNYTIPRVVDKDGDLDHSKCEYYSQNYSTISSVEDLQSLTQMKNNSEVIQSCSSWYYDTSIHGSTVVSEWDLVCDRRWLMSMTQSSYMFGILIGAVVTSAFSDKIGRRKTALACIVVFFLSSVGAAFSTDLLMFLGLRFLVAASGQGMGLSKFVLLMEVLNEKGRTSIPLITGQFWAVGSCLLPLLAYDFKDWRVLQLVTGSSSIVLLTYFWILPESPRWLLMQNRFTEGIAVLEKMAKTNGGELPPSHILDTYIKVISSEALKTKKRSYLKNISEFIEDLMTLVRTPNLRRRSLTIFYCWFVVSSVYFGLNFSGHNINASIYKLMFFSSLVKFPVVPVKLFLLKRYGRRLTMSLSFALCGISCLFILVVPNEYAWLNMTLVIMGTATVGIAFGCAFLVSSELVPTNIRNLSVGIGSMWGRVGSIITPFIVDLLGEIYYAIPSTFFGGLSLLAAALSLLLPETGFTPLPESIEEIESLPR